jgi:threonylcarbamoyladenosine tRNA methylthiotransferase MtaB
MPSIAIATLGCKLNQLESEAIAALFKEEGFRLVPWTSSADILVVNTCTVTSKAEQKARRLIRGALRDNPASLLIVTGCYAQLDGPALAALEGELTGEVPSPAESRLAVVPGDLKSALLNLPRYLNAVKAPASGKPRETVKEGEGPESLKAGFEKWRGNPAEGRPFAFNIGGFSFHSRASLKIQDGCDHACSYCRVNLARGKSVSLDPETALSRLRELEDRGYGEAVLTGVNINQYRYTAGPELEPACLDLGGLLNFLLRGTSHIALRLSSLEPEGLTPEFLAVLENSRIRPHFHLSIQSGSGEILRRMRRRYTPEAAAAAIGALRSCRDDPFIACDIITGFPGETEAEFERTYEFCKNLDFAWIHAFPYSRRPETEAAAFRPPVSERDATARVETLIDLARRGRAGYIRRWLGKTVEALTEESGNKAAPYSRAVSENYLKLAIPVSGRPGVLPPGKVLSCRIAAFPGGNAGGDDLPRQFDAIGEEITS